MKTEVVDLLSDSSDDDDDDEVKVLGKSTNKSKPMAETKKSSAKSSVEDDEVEVLGSTNKSKTKQTKKPSPKSSLAAAAAIKRLEQQAHGIEIGNNNAFGVNHQNHHGHYPETMLEEEEESTLARRDPYGPLADGESIVVSGSKPSSRYTIKRTGATYYCTCPAWKFQHTAPAAGRTCKHIKALRSDYTDNHVGNQVPAKKAAKKRATAGGDTHSKKAKNVVDKNEEMIEVTLAEKWNPDKHDPTKWLMSEKLDGMRCVWDGRALWSRNGKPIYAPQFFLQALPRNVCLDGELWLGRQQFQDLMSVVNGGAAGAGWSRVQFAIFDAPHATGDFPTRLAVIRAALRAAGTPGGIAHLLEQTRCTGAAQVHAELDAIIRQGGEGLMLRNPKAAYSAGRSKNLLKVKRTLDAEARVVGHDEGKGKHQGRLGALQCTMIPEGKAFKLGTGFTDAQRENPPAIGTIVTYKYQELTKGGVPRFPVFDRVRPEE